MKFSRTTKAIACAGMLAGFAVPQVQASQAITGLNLDDFDVYAGGSVGTIEGVDTFDGVGVAVSVFDGTGTPNIVGSTFTDYIVINETSFSTQTGTTSIVQTDWQLTAVLVATGTIVDTNSDLSDGEFVITGVSNFDLWRDVGGTQGRFNGTQTDFNNFFDGDDVLDAVGLAALRPDANSGDFDGLGGRFDIEFEVTQGADYQGAGEDPFLNEAGASTTDLFDLYSAGIVTLSDGNLTAPLSGTLFPGSDPATGIPTLISWFDSYFSIGLAGQTVLVAAIQADPTTDFAVPAPAPLALLGIGLLGIASRKKLLSKA